MLSFGKKRSGGLNHRTSDMVGGIGDPGGAVLVFPVLPLALLMSVRRQGDESALPSPLGSLSSSKLGRKEAFMLHVLLSFEYQIFYLKYFFLGVYKMHKLYICNCFRKTSAGGESDFSKK